MYFQNLKLKRIVIVQVVIHDSSVSVVTRLLARWLCNCSGTGGSLPEDKMAEAISPLMQAAIPALSLVFMVYCFIKHINTLLHIASWYIKHVDINPLNTEFNPICKSQLAKLFCGVFKFCAWFSKNLNILRTKRDTSVKQTAFYMEENRHCSVCLQVL